MGAGVQFNRLYEWYRPRRANRATRIQATPVNHATIVLTNSGQSAFYLVVRDLNLIGTASDVIGSTYTQAPPAVTAGTITPLDPTQSAMAANAPPPPPQSEVVATLNQESKAADQAEQEAAADTGAPVGEPPTVALGQTPDQVVAALGQPKSIMDLGAKKIYVYKDAKVTFRDGKVADIQ